MYKIVAAVAAVLLSGVVGGLTLPSSDAQSAPRVRMVETRPAAESEVIELVEEDGVWLQARRGEAAPRAAEFAPLQVMRGGQAGTWQIVTNRDVTILLNTATGETFHLAEKEGHLAWKPIERPGTRAEMPALPRMREMPGMPPMPDRPAQPDRPNPDRPNADRLRKALEDARKRLKEAEGEEREALKRKIAEVEKTLHEMEKQDSRDKPRGEVQELETLLERLGDKIGMLEKKIKETDSKREAAELEGMVNELRGEVKRVKQELEAARKEQKERDKDRD